MGSRTTATEVSSRQTLASLRVNSLQHGSLVSPERDQGYRMLAVIYSHLHISPDLVRAGEVALNHELVVVPVWPALSTLGLDGHSSVKKSG